MIRFLLIAGMEWTDKNQGLMALGAVLTPLIGSVILRVIA